jgi:hypothetical protein
LRLFGRHFERDRLGNGGLLRPFGHQLIDCEYFDVVEQNIRITFALGGRAIEGLSRKPLGASREASLVVMADAFMIA